MKLRRLPEDFRVEELPLVEGGSDGPFRYYRLTKRSLGTIEALAAVRRRWRLAPSSLGYGGLKDRHAETVQYLTIRDGPDRPLRERSFHLEPLGCLTHPYGPLHSRGNRFTLAIRDLSPDQADRAVRVASTLASDGVPNYFDDQRFGSLAPGGDFIARAWLSGDPERALGLALAEPNPNDRSWIRTEKAHLRRAWGRWSEVLGRLRRPEAQAAVAHLARRPSDFRGGFARLPREARRLYFAAFQSHLWNRMLGRRIEQLTRPDQRTPIAFKAAILPLYHDLAPDQVAELAATPLPLPTARTAEPSGPVGQLAREVLSAFGLAWNDLRIRGLDDVFLSKGDRAAVVFPQELASTSEPDDLYPGRLLVRLAFVLPRGAYATLVVKRVTETQE